MIIDNLTIAGVLITSAYASMPFFFGRELFRVEECADEQTLPPTGRTVASRAVSEECVEY